MRIEGDVKRVGLFRLAVELGLVSFGGGIVLNSFSSMDVKRVGLFWFAVMLGLVSFGGGIVINSFSNYVLRSSPSFIYL